MSWWWIIYSLTPRDPFTGAWQRVADDGARRVAHLGRNLAVAGALQRMFDLGWDRGHACGDVSVSADEWLRAKREAWIPNTDGKAAP